MRNIKLIIFITTFFVFESCSILKQKENIDFKEISHGIIKASGTKIKVDNENKSASGNTVSHEKFEIIKVTDTIKGSIGQVFGVEFKISSTKNKYFELDRTWTFPVEIINPNGKKIKSVTRPDYVVSNVESWMYYTLETESEIVEGNWTLQYFYKGKEVYKKTFYIKK